MTPIVRLLKWLLGAAIFFILFVFALNNRSAVSVQLFAGHGTDLPLVVVILLAFASGIVLGMLTGIPLIRAKHPTKASAPQTAPSTASKHFSIDNDPTQDGI